MFSPRNTLHFHLKITPKMNIKIPKFSAPKSPLYPGASRPKSPARSEASSPLSEYPKLTPRESEYLQSSPGLLHLISALDCNILQSPASKANQMIAQAITQLHTNLSDPNYIPPPPPPYSVTITYDARCPWPSLRGKTHTAPF